MMTGNNLSNWDFQWKINFKQSQEVFFSRKLPTSDHPSLTFSGSNVFYFEIQSHLHMFLDSKLDFKEHAQNVFNKVSKTVRLLHKLMEILSLIKHITCPFMRNWNPLITMPH